MSFEKNEEKEQNNKEQSFLGKKIKSPNSFEHISDTKNTLLTTSNNNENKNIAIKEAKVHNEKENLNQINFKNLNSIKENEAIRPDCLNNEIIQKKQVENTDIICYICGKKYPEKNIVYYNVNQKQKAIFENEFLNKNISLDENEDNLLNSKKISWIIKICNNCIDENNEIFEKIFNKKMENEINKKPNNNNIIDELTNLISKEKGEMNIFNILESKSDNSIEDNAKTNKNKNKDLFETFVINKPDNEALNKKQNNQITEKKEDNISININNDNYENESKVEYPKINEATNDNNNNLNKDNNNDNIIINNKKENENLENNENISNNSPENINNNNILNSNLIENNINPFLYMNQNNTSMNINSINKNSNLYIPHFLTTTSLTNSQNINPILSNYNTNNNISSIIDPSNINNNYSPLNEIKSNNIKEITCSSSIIPGNNNNKLNSNLSNQNNSEEDNKNIISFIKNINPNFNNNNNFNSQSNINNNMNNLSNRINQKIGLNENMNINNIKPSIDDKDIKQDNIINPINNKVNNINININNNLIGLSYEIKNTINKISKDLFSFDNDNIENNINILYNIQTLTNLFSRIITEQNNNPNINDNNSNNDFTNLLNQQKSINDLINNNNVENIKKEDNNNINNNNNNNNNNINNNSENYKELFSNMNLSEIFNINPTIRGLANYILSVNDSLKSQIKTLKMYIEIQKVFVSILYQNLDIFIKNLCQGQPQPQSPNPQLQNKDPNNNNILPQIKDINTQNNQNNILPQIPPPQMSLNTLNNFQSLNHSNKSLINSSNLNYNSPIIMPPIPQFLQNNNFGRGLTFLDFPGQQFKQDFSSNMPNLFNGPPLNIYPQQQGMGPVGNKSFTQNIPQMLPIINQMNTNGNNNSNIPNNLQFGNNQQNNMKSN